MNEPTPEELPSSDLSRRKMLQRSAFVVGAAAVWSTPIVQTLGQRPAAATGTPFVPEFSWIGARVTISGSGSDGNDGTYWVKYERDGSEADWVLGSIGQCSGDLGASQSDTLGSDINLNAQLPTNPNDPVIEICYTGAGTITWEAAVIFRQGSCQDPESSIPTDQDCLEFMGA